jgi:hypothetical protein
MSDEVKLMLEDIVDSMSLTNSEKEKFLPIWNRNRRLFVQKITEFGQRQYERGKDQHIDFLQT